MSSLLEKALLLAPKYNRPGPRYTSYPTAPNWSDLFGEEDFVNALKGRPSEKSLSLYFHIPFCEERCTFCACSVTATRKRSVTPPYLKALFREVEMISSYLKGPKKVTQLHWGGGTPTYLSTEEITALYQKITKHFSVDPNGEISIEIDPRVTTEEHLKALRELGFNRASLGVQDINPQVQKEAGRIQPLEITRRTIETCRELGFQSVNIDLVYGLPKQTPQGFQETLLKIIELSPDRVALFNFAFVPWMFAHQRKMNEADMPNAEAKLRMFVEAIHIFENAGYQFIGMDHFAKKTDELCKAQRDGTMYRNFQGYTTQSECDLIGMGVTAISYVNGCFAQNEKILSRYQSKAESGKPATVRGMRLSKEDLTRQKWIRELFCHQRIELNDGFEKEKEQLRDFESDSLIVWDDNRLEVTDLGRLFIRNIGMVFDTYLKRGEGKFSKTV